MQVSQTLRRFSLVILTAAYFMFGTLAHADSMQSMAGHVPTVQMGRAQHLGRAPKDKIIQFSVAMKFKDPAGLAKMIERLHSPGDPLYGKFLTPQQIAANFSPSDQDYQDMQAHLTKLGFKVTGISANKLQINVEASVATIEKALKTEIHSYKTAKGVNTFSLTSDPQFDAAKSAKIHGFIGLHGFAGMKSNLNLVTSSNQAVAQGSGPAGFLSPTDIKKAYSLTGVTWDGSGETIAIIAGSNYQASDILTYTNQFGLPTASLQNIMIDGFNGATNGDANEATGDIELVTSLAPRAKILVYEYDGTSTSGQLLVDLFNKIATDNLASVITQSFSFLETAGSAPLTQALNNINMQMAAQGQTMFNSSGDHGYEEDTKSMSINGYASLPYITVVGGTAVTLDNSQNYVSETTWNQSNATDGIFASGGGISSIMPLPSYQIGFGTKQNFGSANFRMEPDVSLGASTAINPYCFYTNGAWMGVGGTSSSTPLWAAFAILVNQHRHSKSLASLGFANAIIYRIGQSSIYGQMFHDISDGSNNQFYPAITGYDLSTGWGSFVGLPLLNLLSGTVFPPNPPTGLTLQVTN